MTAYLMLVIVGCGLAVCPAISFALVARVIGMMGRPLAGRVDD